MIFLVWWRSWAQRVAISSGVRSLSPGSGGFVGRHRVVSKSVSIGAVMGESSSDCADCVLMGCKVKRGDGNIYKPGEVTQARDKFAVSFEMK